MLRCLRLSLALWTAFLVALLSLHAFAVEPSGYAEIDDVLVSLEGLPLDEFFEGSFRELMLRDPEYVTALGLSATFGVRDDRLTDISPEYTAATHALERGVLKLLRTYDARQLGPGAAVHYETYAWFLDDLVRMQPYIYHRYELTGFLDFGVPGAIDELFANLHPLRTRAEIEDYLARLGQVEGKIEHLLGFVDHQWALGIETPAFMLRSCAAAIERMLGIEHQRFRSASDVPVAWVNAFQSFDARLDEAEDLTDEERDAYRSEARPGFREGYIPTLWRLRDYVNGRLPDAPIDGGATTMPDGEGYFTTILRHETSTDLTPDEVHQIGLREVARLQREIEEQFDVLGYPATLSLVDRWQRSRDDDTYHDGRTASGFETILGILETYREETVARIQPVVHLWSTQPFEMIQAPPDAGANYYMPPSWDGSRPGAFYVASAGWVAESQLMVVFHHEAIPGHHGQLALSQELDLPMFMRFMTSNGLVEGWALYCERLMYDLGMYEGRALDNLARLGLEMTRAARLVVDTGIHAYGWTRQEEAAYYEEVLGYPSGAYLGAMERYVLLPGQGSSYMVGKLVIEELRDRAISELGDAFRLADFHDAVLGSGGVPLEILELQVEGFIDEASDS